MSPITNPNEILSDDNYFLWEFNARMALARKDLLDHLEVKPEDAVNAPAQWKAADVKALAVVSKLLSPTYQMMVREANSAWEAWQILRAFFMKQSLHNRVQLRKQLHEFAMASGGSLMEHLVQFDELCAKLAAVGDALPEEEKLVILLGSVPSEYDAMVRLIEVRDRVTLLDAKEMLRREYEMIQKREVKEQAFKATVSDNGGRFQNGRGGRRGRNAKGHGRKGHNGGDKKEFKGRCYECHEAGHKKQDCPRLKGNAGGSEFAFSAMTAGGERSSTWLLDSGASSHMTTDRNDFSEYRPLTEPIEIMVANGQRVAAIGMGTVRVNFTGGVRVKLTDVLHVQKLDRKLLSVPALMSKNLAVQFDKTGASISLNGRVIVRVLGLGNCTRVN